MQQVAGLGALVDIQVHPYIQNDEVDGSQRWAKTRKKNAKHDS